MPEPSTNDTNSARPPTLDHVVGQGQTVAKLRVAVAAAWADTKPLDHVLLTGPAGVGKTMLAKVLAAEMAGEFHEAMGQSLWSLASLNGFFLSAESPNAVLFIDEAHMASVDAQTAMLRGIDDRALFVSDPRSDQATRIDLVPFTLILATTDPQRLLPPLRDRMKLVCQLGRYGLTDLAGLMKQKAAQLGWRIDEAALPSIAQRAMGTPRLALRLLESARRTARAGGDEAISAAHIERTVALEGLDALGLGADEQRYLSILSEASVPVQLAVLASRLGQPPEAVARVIESNLLWLGLVERGERGRVLTAKGIQHVRGVGGEPSIF